MERIVTDYTREAGVRNLERQLATVCRKVARRVLEKPNAITRITLKNLEQYLGASRYTNAPPLQRTQIGSAMGLAWTEMGGILLPVEVVTMVGKGDLQVTGQLGDVMRESVQAALSYIRTRSEELHIDPNFQDATDLHIHLPENAISKDGPSAGITIATAIVSALTRRPVRTDLAMTGEITLLGSVLGIGGLKEKVLAAQQSNIHHLIIPLASKKDLNEIPQKIRQQIDFTFVDNMDQVLEKALLPEEPVSEDMRMGDSLPLRLDASSEQRRRSNMATGEHNPDEADLDDPPSFLISPSDHTSHDVFPSARAEYDDDHTG